MSNASGIAIILSKTSREAAIEIIASSLEHLIDRHDFGFRGYGCVVAERYIDGQPVNGAHLTEFTSATQLDPDRLRELGRQEQAFLIGGSLRLDGVDQLIDLEIVLHPTFAADGSACVVYWLERDLYTRVEGEDGEGFDPEAAELLTCLCVELGAHDLVDGFMVTLLGDRTEVVPFSGPDLAMRVAHPAKVLDQYHHPELRMGFLDGLRAPLVDAEALRAFWKGANVFETSNGFVVLNTFVDIRNRLRSK